MTRGGGGEYFAIFFHLQTNLKSMSSCLSVKWCLEFCKFCLYCCILIWRRFFSMKDNCIYIILFLNRQAHWIRLVPSKHIYFANWEFCVVWPTRISFLDVFFIYLALPTRAGSPQQHKPITVGPFYLTHPVNFPCGRKPEYPGKTHDFRQSVDLYSFHMRTGFESHWEST
jgi:hypothetical protein